MMTTQRKKETEKIEKFLPTRSQCEADNKDLCCNGVDGTINTSEISKDDLAYIRTLKDFISRDLEKVPSYNDDFSLLRWLNGWQRNLDQIVPRLSVTLQTIAALNLHGQDFSSIEKVIEYVGSISKPLKYLPCTLLGYDKSRNVISLVALGRLDPHGLLKSMRHSDLYITRIAESEGVMNLIRIEEARLKRIVGTTVIVDLNYLSARTLTMHYIKVMGEVLSHLQNMFPDVVKRIFIIHAPRFLTLIWYSIASFLSKETLEKVHFLGKDWQDKLKEFIDDGVLNKLCEGAKGGYSLHGNICVGGKVPSELIYNGITDPPEQNLKEIEVLSRSKNFITVQINDTPDENKKLYWWWRVDSGFIKFSILKANDPNVISAECPEDILIRPKFRLQTDYIPESGTVLCTEPGLYKLVFDNTDERFWTKRIRYFVQIIDN